jgi:saccharopine dehydrogenase (NADP+, L-glutamate forming)
MDKKHILILGAGRSSSSLIHYTISQAKLYDWLVTVGDISRHAAEERIAGTTAKAIAFNIEEQETSKKIIAQVDLVVSVLPAHLHIKVAYLCLELRKHLLTASYVTDEMKDLDQKAKTNNLIFLNECGLDPGIDHMSAMQVIDKIRNSGGKLHSFESFTGGLIAPETDPGNPWRYKFTWNPRNVVMAGQGTAKFLQEGQFKFIPYQQLFLRTTPISVEGYGEFEGYANRDSLKYLDTYNLQGIKTILRGTLRNKGFCKAWNILVQLGCTEDNYQMEGVNKMTHRGFVNSFLEFSPNESVEEKFCKTFNLSPLGGEMKKFEWSSLFSDELVGLSKGTPAQILEHILNKKWKLNAGDKDFIIMWHRFVYEINGVKKEIQASLAAIGEDEINTAMSKTVGLPLAIAAKLVMEGKIKSRGVLTPVDKEFYEPILNELGNLGIRLTEKEITNV